MWKVLAAGGGASVVLYFVFQHLGKSWIENKFERHLQQLKHDHALELQRLRGKIDAMLNATSQLQSIEFREIPKSWELLNEAYNRISSLVAAFQQYTDLNRMSEQELEEFFVNSEMSPSEIASISKAGNKTNEYIKYKDWKRLNEAKRAFFEF